MSYGLTPYDKKNYKESKKRRKQALIADKTGRILPYGSTKRRVIIILCITVAVLCLVAVGFFVVTNFGLINTDSKSQSQQMQSNEQLLVIVNRQNVLEKDYVPELKNFGGVKVSALAYDNLNAMVSDAKEQGVELSLLSGYVSFDDQQKAYEQTLDTFLANPDYTQVRAQAAVQKIVPQGGQSEAQTGLLLGFDVTDKNVSAYLERNCVKFGFVLRYSQDKQDITSMSYNNSLYRYVGTDNAVKMRTYDMCLEQYAEYLSLQNIGN